MSVHNSKEVTCLVAQPIAQYAFLDLIWHLSIMFSNGDKRSSKNAHCLLACLQLRSLSLSKKLVTTPEDHLQHHAANFKAVLVSPDLKP